MSVIAHRCDCGHLDMSHANEHGRCSFDYCRCTVIRDAVAGPSEVVMAYDNKLQPVPAPVAPGEFYGSGLGPRVRTCACDECKALYERAA